MQQIPNEHSEQQSDTIDINNEVTLTLFNDDVNTFDFVISSLIEICKHTYEQASQCALITHLKGKCVIKKGQKSELTIMDNKLNNRGLKSKLT